MMIMREQWGFSCAREIIFGLHAVKRLGSAVQKLGCKYPLVVTDQTVKDIGLLEGVNSALKDSGINYGLFDKSEPEPSISFVNDNYKKIRDKKYDAIIALGGGSVIDLGKAFAILISFGGNIADYLGEGKIPGPTVPIVAVPTTAGTGSSVSPTIVLTDKAANTKKGVRDNRLRPDFAIVDPLLTLSCPPFITACVGIDVLAHAVESYTAIPFEYLPVSPEEDDAVVYHGAYPLTDGIARDAITLVGKNLRIAVDQGRNIDARKNMALANIMAGMAFSNSGTTAVHAMALPLGAVSHAPHGLVNGLLLPHVLEYNIPVCAQRLTNIACWLGERIEGLSEFEAARKAVDHIKKLIIDVGLPSRMREIGVKESDIRAMAENTIQLESLLRLNPRKLSLEDIESIYRSAF
jgi:alcohol dehydrogenase